MTQRAGHPAHVHGEAVRKALQEARPAGLHLKQLVKATKRTPAQVWTGIRFLRKTAVKAGLPPVTFSRRHGFQLSEEPEAWIAYERAIFEAELHRITNFIAGIVAPPRQTYPEGRVGPPGPGTARRGQGHPRSPHPHGTLR
jgi:hypothetical protein